MLVRIAWILVVLTCALAGWSVTRGFAGDSPAPAQSLNTLTFAIVGDCHPANTDDTAGYPTSVIQKIWTDVEANKPPFAITTGNYMNASSSGNQQGPQLQQYRNAMGHFTGRVFPAMGKNECTGKISDNCVQSSSVGLTNNYQQFMTTMLGPLNKSLPYYVVNVNANDKSWTAKFVFIASNAWSHAQATWLDSTLGHRTTYTFIVRSAPNIQAGSPGVRPSNKIIAKHPYTLLIEGTIHTCELLQPRELIVGNGGAPLTGNGNYGYVIATQNSNGSMKISMYDYSTNSVTHSFTVSP